MSQVNRRRAALTWRVAFDGEHLKVQQNAVVGAAVNDPVADVRTRIAIILARPLGALKFAAALAVHRQVSAAVCESAIPPAQRPNVNKISRCINFVRAKSFQIKLESRTTINGRPLFEHVSRFESIQHVLFVRSERHLSQIGID